MACLDLSANILFVFAFLSAGIPAVIEPSGPLCTDGKKTRRTYSYWQGFANEVITLTWQDVDLGHYCSMLYGQVVHMYSPAVKRCCSQNSQKTCIFQPMALKTSRFQRVWYTASRPVLAEELLIHQAIFRDDPSSVRGFLIFSAPQLFPFTW